MNRYYFSIALFLLAKLARGSNVGYSIPRPVLGCPKESIILHRAEIIAIIEMPVTAMVPFSFHPNVLEMRVDDSLGCALCNPIGFPQDHRRTLQKLSGTSHAIISHVKEIDNLPSTSWSQVKLTPQYHWNSVLHTISFFYFSQFFSLSKSILNKVTFYL